MSDNIPVSFWKRLSALILDGLILLLLSSPVFLYLLYLNDFSFGKFQVDKSPLTVNLIYYVLPIIYIAYEVIMTASKYQGTLGKHFTHIKVVGRNFCRISIFTSFLRFFLKTPSSVLALLLFSTPYIGCADYLDGVAFLGYFLIFATKSKQALHDVLAKTYVVYK